MIGKTVVLTGGTSGIGAVAAERLAAMGARIVLVARSERRAAGTLARLREISPKAGHNVHYADLTRISEMKRVAAEIYAAEPRVDVLVNNAGALFGTRKLTEDGLETTFALDHMAYFVLSRGLLPRLVASAPSRIVNTASAAHKYARLDLENAPTGRDFRPMKAYCHSKLCNILFTRELAHQLVGTGVTVNCLHPGFVATRFADESGGLFSRFAWIGKLFAISPEEGADTIVYLASSPEIASTTGEYFYRRRPIRPSDEAKDDRNRAALWARSLALAT